MKKHLLAVLTVAALAGWSQAKVLPGQQAAPEAGAVATTLVNTVTNPKEFKVTGNAEFQGKSGLRLSAHERGSAAWPVPESLAGKAVEVQFSATMATGEAEVYFLVPGGAMLGAQTLRAGHAQVRVAAKLPTGVKGQMFLRLDLQPRTQVNLSDVRVFVVQRN